MILCKVDCNLDVSTKSNCDDENICTCISKRNQKFDYQNMDISSNTKGNSNAF